MATVVYVLSNPAMPGLVKIGRVDTNERIQSRMAELYATGVPVPFKCEYAMQVSDANMWEKRLHRLFKAAQINPKREFFKLDPEELISILREGKFGKEVTPSSDTHGEGVSRAEVKAGESIRRRKPMRFSDLDIPEGATLEFFGAPYAPDVKAQCTVVRDNFVLLDEEEVTLSEATRRLLNVEWKGVRPALYWKYEGRFLADVYDEKYPREEED